MKRISAAIELGTTYSAPSSHGFPKLLEQQAPTFYRQLLSQQNDFCQVIVARIKKRRGTRQDFGQPLCRPEIRHVPAAFIVVDPAARGKLVNAGGNTKLALRQLSAKPGLFEPLGGWWSALHDGQDGGVRSLSLSKYLPEMLGAFVFSRYLDFLSIVGGANIGRAGEAIDKATGPKGKGCSDRKQ